MFFLCMLTPWMCNKKERKKICNKKEKKKTNWLHAAVCRAVIGGHRDPGAEATEIRVCLLVWQSRVTAQLEAGGRIQGCKWNHGSRTTDIL